MSKIPSSWGSFRILTILFFVLCAILIEAQAQPSPQQASQPPPQSQPQLSEAPSGGAVLTGIAEYEQKAKEITNNLENVEKINEDGYLVFLAPKSTYKVGTNILIMRPEGDVVDIVASGSVVGQKGQEVVVELNTASIMKAPYKGDLITIMAPPWSPSDKDEELVLESPLETESVPLPPEPGYVEILIGTLSGSVYPTSSTQANAYKKANSFDFQSISFAWYFEFLWNFGYEYNSFSGIFPTSTYFRDVGESTYRFSQFGFNYRFRGYDSGSLRPVIRFYSLTDKFETINPDEALISSQYNGFGVGLRIEARFGSELWKTDKYFPPLILQNLYVEAGYVPSLTATDLTISRGESSGGSKAFEYAIGATSVIYLKWMPMASRWIVSGKYVVQSYDLTYSGPTKSEEGGFYTIPEGGRYKEQYSYLMLNFGLRFDDYVGKFLNPR
jgi:hypothetical protein